MSNTKQLAVEPRRIAIVGTGAMGGVYAAHFAEAGHTVIAVDTWSDHVDAINKQGLHVTGVSGDRVIETIQATQSVADAGDCDLYVIATKASGVGDAAKAIMAAMPSHAQVLTIQNGLGAIERIGRYMPLDNVLLGVAEGFGASVPRAGTIHHNAMKMIRLGEIDGGTSERLVALEALWQHAGFNAKAFDDIRQLVWEKFVCNVALSGPSALFECTIGELLNNPQSREMSLGCLLEAHAIGLLEGITFSFDDPVDYLDKFVALMPDSRPSLQQDVTAGRFSEIDAINGMVPVLAEKHAVGAPFNTVVTNVIRSIESRLPQSH